MLLFPSPKIAAGEAKLTDHGGQETRRDFLAEVFDDRLPWAVVERDMAPLAAFGFHPHGHGTRCAQLAHPLNEFPAFYPAMIGQKCPNSNRRVFSLPIVRPNSPFTTDSFRITHFAVHACFKNGRFVSDKLFSVQLARPRRSVCWPAFL